MQLAFYFDASRCMQCFACEVACKSVHDLRPHVNEKPGTQGPRYRRVVQLESVESGEPKIAYFSLACMHCGKPACEAVCPTGAITKRLEDGIVLVDQNKCIGCHYCFYACPFGIPQYGDDGTMEKCDMCVDRIAEGKQPACVEACCGGALKFGTVEDLAVLRAERVGAELETSVQPSLVLVK